MPAPNTPETFRARLVRRGACDEWAGGTRNGYGVINYQGRLWYAHRLQWTLSRGPIPVGMFVCHHCDNKLCGRIEHLYLGTNAENVADAKRKGLVHPGSKHGMARLDEAQVDAVRARLSAGERGSDIAASLGVHRNTIYHIKKGRTWTWSA